MSNYDESNVMTEFLEEAARLEQTNENSNDDFLKKFVTMPEGEGYVIVRLMPALPGKKSYCITRTHRLQKDPSKKFGRNFHCPRELEVGKNGKRYWVDRDPKDPCPVCLFTRAVWADVEAAGGKDAPAAKGPKAEYDKIKAIERIYYNAMVRFFNKKGELEKSEGPKILSIGQMLHEKIVRAAVGDPKAGEKGLGNITCTKTGRDLKIVKKLRPGSNQPYYDESKFLDPSPLGTEEEIEIWMGTRHDLNALRAVKPTSEIDIALQKYTGALPDDETNFDMSKYRKKAATVEEQVHNHKQEAPIVVRTEAATKAPASGDEVLADNDFLKGIEADVNAVQ